MQVEAERRRWLALEQAETIVSVIADEFPSDEMLEEGQRCLRALCERAEARHLDALLTLERAAEERAVATR